VYGIHLIEFVAADATGNSSGTVNRSVSSAITVKVIR
jgi:hypothetical protein